MKNEKWKIKKNKKDKPLSKIKWIIESACKCSTICKSNTYCNLKMGRTNGMSILPI